MEVVNFPSDVHDQVLKLASINLCPNVSGQICCTLMMTPPEPGQPSYELYVQVRPAWRPADVRWPGAAAAACGV
jgi:alanine transaminase